MKNLKKTFVLFQVVSSFFFTSALFADNPITRWIEDADEGVGSNLGDWLPSVLVFAIGFSALVCIGVLIGSGYMYITAAGDEEKIRKGGKSITWALIGLGVCVISALLVEFVLIQFLEQTS
jgi:hypothetical protein